MKTGITTQLFAAISSLKPKTGTIWRAVPGNAGEDPLISRRHFGHQKMLPQCDSKPQVGLKTGITTQLFAAISSLKPNNGVISCDGVFRGRCTR